MTLTISRSETVSHFTEFGSAITFFFFAIESHRRPLAFAQTYDVESAILLVSKWRRINVVGLNRLKFSVRRKDSVLLMQLSHLWIMYALGGKSTFSIKWRLICLHINLSLKTQTCPWWCLEAPAVSATKKRRRTENKGKSKLYQPNSGY